MSTDTVRIIPLFPINLTLNDILILRDVCDARADSLTGLVNDPFSPEEDDEELQAEIEDCIRLSTELQEKYDKLTSR